MSGQNSDSILLFVMRHGEAEAARRDDKSRKLTEFGRSQAIASSSWLHKYSRDGSIDMALVSPYQRTRQTFDMMTQSHKFGDVEVCDDIVPDGDIHLAHDYVDALLGHSRNKPRPIKSVLLVSHMPFVSYLMDELCQNQLTPLFATGSVAVIDYSLDSHKGTLLEHYQGR